MACPTIRAWILAASRNSPRRLPKAGGRPVWTLLIVGVLTVVSTVPSFAHPYGSIPRGDNAYGVENSVDHNNDNIAPLYYSLGDPAMRDAVAWSVANVYDPTDLHVFLVSTSDPSQHDANLHDRDYGINGLVGWHNCPSYAAQGGSHPDHWCMDNVIRFNRHYSAAYNTTNERRGLACHELGHMFGLRHTNDDTGYASCMYNEGWYGSRWGSRYGLTGHEVDHIQLYY